MFNNTHQDRHPFHPLCFELIKKVPKTKHDLHSLWTQESGDSFIFTNDIMFSEFPIIASPELSNKLNNRTLDLCHDIKHKLKKNSLNSDLWPNAPDADVITIDYAIIQDQDSSLGWDIRLVEFQAFTSILATGFFLYKAHKILWPQLCESSAWGNRYGQQNIHDETQWKSICSQWQSSQLGCVLLEYNPQFRSSTFDLNATSRLWSIPIVEPHQLITNDSQLSAIQGDGKTIPVQKILNRLILSDIASDPVFIDKIKHAQIQWHNHPAWYFAINKGTATEFSLRNEPINVRADNWRLLNLPATSLVAKNIYSCAGKDLLISPSEMQLNTLQNAHEWLVQPKYCPFTVFQDDQKESIFAEVRLIVCLKNVEQPWIAMQLVKLYRGTLASASSFQGRQYEGVTLLHNPPQ